MIGMDFGSFLALLIISVVVSAILHYALKFYLRAGTASYLSKVVIGWFRAWLGSPVFGHWWEGLSYGEVYYVPAILGSFAPRAGGGRREIDLRRVPREEEEAPAEPPAAQF